jgi:DNA-binding XRE family transcriptional regulator
MPKTQSEDADDLAAVRAQRAHEAEVGYEVATVDYLTVEEAERLLGGESAVRVWREKRGMTQRALAAAVDAPPGYLSEIESGKKVGSLTVWRGIARELHVPLEDVLPED